MAHEVESAMYVNRAAWHGIGTVVDEAPTTEEAIRLAGLDWNVIEEEIYIQSSALEYTPIPDYVVLTRSTDKQVLGIVSSNYKPLQNHEAFNWFDPILALGDAKLEAAGSLKKGERIWILAKINQTADIGKDDPVESYLLLHNSHNGCNAVGIQFTCIRVVCMNTLSQAIRASERGDEASVRIRHSMLMPDAMKVAQEAVIRGRKTFEVTIEQYRELQRKQLPIEGLEKYIKEVFEVKAEDKMPRAFKKIEENYCAEPRITGTYWAAYNAFTLWLDHQRGHNADSRMESSWFGQGKTLRDRAFAIALRN